MDKVRFNVRGRIFVTTGTTLSVAPRDSMFGAMFDDDWNLQANEEERFIDRNPDYFSVLLDLLGTGELYLPPNLSEKLLYKEAQYYGLLENVKAAKFCKLDGKQLKLTSTVKGQASGNCIAISASPSGGCDFAHTISASPSGGCAVAYPRIVRLYDWTLEEHPPIYLNYQIVNNIGWIDSENIVISARKRSGPEDSGLALFNSSTGHLRHKFQLNHDNHVKSFTAGALCFSSDAKIAASCNMETPIFGCGIWDQVTGQQTDFFPETVRSPLCYPDRMQWLKERSCLLSAKFHRPTANGSCIRLLDLRDKSMVWSWSDVNETSVRQGPIFDATAMEDANSICVVNQFNDLGFLDIRSTGSIIRWNSDNWKSYTKLPKVEPCYPRLKLHGGQLFSCRNYRISIFCGPDWFLTSSLGSSCGGGAICDLSIGGDRLYALHSEENLFDVWETPFPPNLW